MTDEKQSDEPETIEGSATEVTPAESSPPTTTTEIPTGPNDPDPAPASIAVQGPQNPPSAIVPLAAEDVVRGMTAYQELLPQLLTDSDYQTAERGKKFVKKSGWRKIARAFGLSVEIRSQHVERDEEGMPLRANVVARAVHAPSGQFSDGDGGCSTAESRFGKPQGRQKLENDLLATATTRAKNRAISDLVGMGDVSAEEIDGGGGGAPPMPPYGPEASRGARQTCGNALTYLFDGDREAARGEIAKIEEAHGGYLPVSVVSGISTAAAIVKARQEPADAEEGDGDGDGEEPEAGGDEEKSS